MIYIVAVVAFLLGVIAIFAGAWAIDSYHSWRYRRNNLQELRERPSMPHGRYFPYKFEVWREESLWHAYACDGINARINVYSSGEHPMDAVRNLIEELAERHKQEYTING